MLLGEHPYKMKQTPLALVALGTFAEGERLQ
jgi:hypothetical protein